MSKSEARRVCGNVSEAGVSIWRRQGFEKAREDV